MSRVNVSLTKEHYELLRRLAEQEHRYPPDQAAYLLEQQLRRLAQRGKIAEREPVASA